MIDGKLYVMYILSQFFKKRNQHKTTSKNTKQTKNPQKNPQEKPIAKSIHPKMLPLGTSLVARWLRIRLPMQGTRV